MSTGHNEDSLVKHPPKIRTIEDAVERIYGLNLGVIGIGSGRHERPHKPLLLLTTLDLIALGRAKAEWVPWSEELRERFAVYFKIVRRNDDQNTPENPFYYLRGDGFWETVDCSSGIELPLGNTPTVGEARAGKIYARFTDGMEKLVQFPAQRARLRDALVSRYFPSMRSELTALCHEAIPVAERLAETDRCKEDESSCDSPGRDPAFRKIILQAYDHQCAACGLRIKLPEADFTFIDGAHIIPFRETRNDHPSNGLALCKNHHWAMDRFLIVPTPEGLWKASARLDARRSLGEQALVALHGQPLLPPHDEVFRPDPVGLAWRAERIYA